MSSNISQASSEQRQYEYYDLIMALFVAVLLISNIASSAKIIDLGVSIGPVRLAFDGGTLIFPISYIFGDVLTEVYGYRRARRVIWAGFVASVLMAGTLYLVGILPGESEWQGYAGQSAYDAILGGIPGLIVASLVAYFAGAFSNSVVLARLKLLTAGKWLWLRTMSSTVVGQTIDTTAFIMIAVALGVFPIEIALTLIVTNILFKVGIEAVLLPVTYQVVAFLKQVESEDYFDRNTDFNPFKIGV